MYICRIFFLVLLLLPACNAFSVMQVSINRGNSEKLPIAIVANDINDKFSSTIISIIGDDLIRCGMFKIVDAPTGFSIDSSALPVNSSWNKKSKSSFILGFSVSDVENGELDIKVRLFDVHSNKQVFARSFSTYKVGLRRVSHIIADNVYHDITGEGGYFDTKIAYIADLKDGKKRIAIMDQDGFNVNYITDGGSLVLTPRFSPESQRLVYMSYSGLNARVLVRNIKTGEEEVLGDFTGLNSAPRFSPKGNSVLMARSVNGVTDVYEVNLSDRKRKRLTSRSSINTSPSYSPDQSKIVFNSDRSGSPQIYTMNADGTHQKRISFGGGSYSNPVWSPRGDWIAFIKFVSSSSDKFYIGVMKPDGSGERILHSGYLIESPTWSPNGRVIIFTKEDKVSSKVKTSRLYSIDLTGDNGMYLPTPTSASDPSWSVLLDK